jgi:group I intron endonuclease
MNNVIYRIRNVVNNKFYVGSTINTKRRFEEHRRHLRKGKHQSPHMQAAWNKYGEDCFKFEVIEHVENPEDLLKAEQVWLDEHAGKPYCYNWATDASAPMRGKKHTEEALLKIKETRVAPKGDNHYGKGVPRSEETKAKISEKCKGLPNPMKGKTHSEQSKANMSAAAKRGEEHPCYGKRPTWADDLEKPIRAIKRDRSEEIYKSLASMRDTLGVSVATIIRACKSGKPIRQGVCDGWVLSYASEEVNVAPEIPEEYLEYPRTRQEAKELGVKLYFTGIPCKHGHIAPRKTKGTCMDCLKIEWEETNAKRALLPKSEASKKAGKKYYENNKELVKSRALENSKKSNKLIDTIPK